MGVDSTSVVCPVLPGEGGSTPTSTLHFMRCGLSSVSGFVRGHHYSHTHPGGIDYCFAITEGQRILGACMFGYIAGNPKAMCVCKGIDEPAKYRELMRLVLLDEVPKNSESKFIGYCLRWLKKNTEIVALVSFADPKFGHVGTVYQATNWIYTGIQKQDRDRLILKREDLFGSFEKEIHPKTAYNRNGSSSASALGDIRTEARQPKHRYVYLLRGGLQLKYTAHSYVKKGL